VAQMRVYGQMNEQTRNMMNDSINPDYYRKGIETTDYIQSHSMNYLEGNIIKYVTRYKDKGGVLDLKKAEWYLTRLIKQEENS